MHPHPYFNLCHHVAHRAASAEPALNFSNARRPAFSRIRVLHPLRVETSSRRLRKASRNRRRFLLRPPHRQKQTRPGRFRVPRRTVPRPRAKPQNAISLGPTGKQRRKSNAVPARRPLRSGGLRREDFYLRQEIVECFVGGVLTLSFQGPPPALARRRCVLRASTLQHLIHQLSHRPMRFQNRKPMIHRSRQIRVRKRNPPKRCTPQRLARRRLPIFPKEKSRLRIAVRMPPAIQNNSRDVPLRIESRPAKHEIHLLANPLLVFLVGSR